MRAALKFVITLGTAVYPALWWLMRGNSVQLTALGGAMCLLWIVRAVLDRGSVMAKAAPYIALLFGICAIVGSAGAFMWYPLAVNFALFVAFILSLRKTPVIEVLARLHYAELPEAAKPYLRCVTKIWIVFFAGNGAVIALLSAMRWDTAWAIYTGVISYVLIGMLLGGEWLYRTFVMKKRLEAKV